MAASDAAPIKLLRPIGEFLPPELDAELEREYATLMGAALDNIEKNAPADNPHIAVISIAKEYAALEARSAFHAAIAVLQPLLDDLEGRVAALEKGARK